MDVAATNAHFCEIFLQLLGHPFGKSGNKHPFVHFGPFADFLKQVIHLIFHRTNLNRRVKQSGRPYNLLNHKAFRLLKLVVCRSCAHKYLLSCNLLEFIEFQRSVVRCGRESEPIVNQYALPRMVTTVHGTDLRQGNMALVDECNEILGEIVNQAERPHPFLPSVEIPGIILDSGAITHFLDELEIIFHPLLQSLSLQCLTYGIEIFHLGAHIILNLADGLGTPLFSGHEITGRIDGNLIQGIDESTCNRVYD